MGLHFMALRDKRIFSLWKSSVHQKQTEYEVITTFLGNQYVRFACPGCQVLLRDPLDEVGQGDTCPDCGSALVTPGPDNFKSIYERAKQRQKARLDKIVRGLISTSIVAFVLGLVGIVGYEIYANAGTVMEWVTYLGIALLWLVVVGAVLAVVLLILIAIGSAAENSGSGFNNPFIMIMALLFFLPLGPPGWIVFALLIHFSDSGKK